jgi:hypothetical protein
MINNHIAVHAMMSIQQTLQTAKQLCFSMGICIVIKPLKWAGKYSAGLA